MPYPYFDRDQLEARMGEVSVRRAIGNDPTVFDELALDASSYVASRLKPMYDLALIEADTPREVVRFSLNVASYMLVDKYPELFPQKNPGKLKEIIEHDFDEIRDRRAALNTDSAPEPAAQTDGQVYEGGAVVSDSPECQINFVNSLSKYF